MRPHRRRTDHLAALASLPVDPLARAQAATEALHACGFDVAFAVQAPNGSEREGLLCSVAGHVDPVLQAGRMLAGDVAQTGKALRMIGSESPAGRRMAAVPCGALRDSQLMLVVADPDLTEREAQSIAAWVAPPTAGVDADGGPCSPLAHSLATEFGAEVVVIALFTQSGMLMNLHTRSGALLRAWRVPVDTVWGEAARHGAAFVLGDLHLHPGAESLASLGMNAAAVVGIENGSGVAIGAIGVGASRELDVTIAQDLLERAATIGPQVMTLRSRSRVPSPNAEGAIELRGFAERVGCRRFALYARSGNVLRLVSAHDQNGAVLAAPPDQDEEQLVCWAAEQGVAVASDDAAAVLVGGDTVLYARDPGKRPIECLRLALQDLRHSPFAAGEDGRAAA